MLKYNFLFLFILDKGHLPTSMFKKKTSFGWKKKKRVKLKNKKQKIRSSSKKYLVLNACSLLSRTPFLSLPRFFAVFYPHSCSFKPQSNHRAMLAGNSITWSLFQKNIEVMKGTLINIFWYKISMLQCYPATKITFPSLDWIVI